MLNNDTTMLIKLPSDLKGAYQGLCKARGVSVSEELRRFMADEVKASTKGIATDSKPSKMPLKDKPTRCDKTPDMFETSQNAPQAPKELKTIPKYQGSSKKANRGKSGLSGLQVNGLKVK